jgi:predicted glycosyltransferase
VSAARRFLFYTNECVGLGHFRRALTLAGAVTARDSAANVLIVTGSPASTGYSPPPRVDTIKLPLLARDENGEHRPRSLAIGLDDLDALRTELAVAAAESFRPSVAVVDKTPLGLRDELVPALEALQRSGCRLVLGLRDIEDDPVRVRASWRRGFRDAIERYYDTILVYGPPANLDAIASTGWHGLRVPVEHVGYVAAPIPERRPRDLPESYLVATPGGGADGFALLSTVLDAVRLRPLDCELLLVAGPLMPAEQVEALRARAEHVERVRVEEFRQDMPAVIAGARAVVAMAGYNTVAEVLGAGRPALLVPRTQPSREQLLRAQALAASGRVEAVHPDSLVPSDLRAALDRLLAAPAPPRDERMHGGAVRAATLLAGLADDGAAGVERAAAGAAARAAGG